MPITDAGLTDCYRRIERRLYNVLFRLLWNPQDCQDVMHDAFMRVWRRRESVVEASLEPLLFTTALNLARNQLRWKSLRSFVGLDDYLVATGPPHGDSPDLRRALAALSPGQRKVVLLSEIGGFDTREIARMLGIPEGTVGSRKHQALARIRKMLESSE